VNEIVWKAEEKAELARAAGGDLLFVDMESAGIASACREFGVPFVIIRAISDTAEETLPFDLNRCRKRDGEISGVRVALRAAIQPGTIPRLSDLRMRCIEGSEKLAAFVTQLLGEHFKCRAESAAS
jgi:adenosylhomocysteine nucleosidase